MKKRILITGASGFIGTHLCAYFARHGFAVRALYRRAAPPLELSSIAGLQLCRGDLESDAQAAVQDIDVVIHAAALAFDWGPMEAFKRANVDATAKLLDAAKKAGCSAFYYISSAVVHGFGNHVDTNEEGPYYPLKYPYQITKLEAENLVRMCNSEGFATAIVRPCNVYGPGDRVSTYTMYEAILSTTFGYFDRGEYYTCPIYIDDFCEAMGLVLACPTTAGETILVSDGSKVPWKRYVEIMYDAVGSRKKPLGLPVPAAFAFAHVTCAVAQALKLKNPPPLTLYRVEQGSHHFHFSNSKAVRILGFAPKIFVEDGLVRTAKAFLAERALRNRRVTQG